ncbi:MAG TPA: triose-phosphate isomerase [Firmicutes bacterium]|nr:triose-phosphate isomerase [Bacillota bacterium]
MRKPLIMGNWKMYKTVPEAVRLVKQLKVMLADTVDVEIAVCPPFTALQAVGEVIKGSALKLGAQNLFWEKEGAYTGEISPEMLTDIGVDYCIIGHSERRAYFHETDADVNRKVKAALAAGLGVVMCVGETLEQRRAGLTQRVVEEQVTNGLAGLEVSQADKLVIAYEPVWAIGTGENATGQDAAEVIAMIRRVAAGIVGEEIAAEMRILYGGSVKPGNIKEFMAQPEIDGALVGGASLDASSFAQIVRYN